MTTIEEVSQLADELRADARISRVEVSQFPSTAVSLDVWMNSRMFVLHYLPSQKMFGVDEIQEGEGMGNHYRLGFRELSPARQALLNMLAEASQARNLKASA